MPLEHPFHESDPEKVHADQFAGGGESLNGGLVCAVMGGIHDAGQVAPQTGARVPGPIPGGAGGGHVDTAPAARDKELGVGGRAAGRQSWGQTRRLDVE